MHASCPSASHSPRVRRLRPRYLTLHISIVPLELKEGCDPNAAKVSLMHCYEAWKVEDSEEDSK